MEERDFIAELIEDLGLDDVRGILVVFNDDIGVLSLRIERAAEIGGEDAFRRAAHALAGAAGAVGANALADACRTAMVAPPGSAPQMLAMGQNIRMLSFQAAATLRSIMAEYDQAGTKNA